MSQSPFKFKDETEVLQSSSQKNQHLAWLDEHSGQIIDLHQKIQHSLALNAQDYQLMNILLNTLVCNIMHDRAETDFYITGAK